MHALRMRVRAKEELAAMASAKLCSEKKVGAVEASSRGCAREGRCDPKELGSPLGIDRFSALPSTLARNEERGDAEGEDGRREGEAGRRKRGRDGKRPAAMSIIKDNRDDAPRGREKAAVAQCSSLSPGGGSSGGSEGAEGESSGCKRRKKAPGGHEKAAVANSTSGSPGGRGSGDRTISVNVHGGTHETGGATSSGSGQKRTACVALHGEMQHEAVRRRVSTKRPG